MSEEPGSIAFDRAAEYYDATRGLSEEGARRQNEVLADELRGRGRVLEVGVGTGQVALPLHHAGVDVIGLDLARTMMDKLIEKAGGTRPFPLLQGDAVHLPFADGTFGATYLRWVLHLIPEWLAALAELVRVVTSGGVVLVLLGSAGKDTPQAEIQVRFAEIAGIPFGPPGLMWASHQELDSAMASLGATPRALSAFTEVERDGLGAFLESVKQRRYSWTWRVPDDERFADAVAEIRHFAEERFGPFDRLPPEEYEVAWRAYDVPA